MWKISLRRLRAWVAVKTEQQYCYRGWLLEISHFRLEIALILQDSPSLQTFAKAAFLDSYQKARKSMLKAIGLSPDVIPEVPDFTIEEALDEEWLPWQSDLKFIEPTALREAFWYDLSH